MRVKPSNRPYDGLAYDARGNLTTPEKVTKLSKKIMSGIDRMSKKRRRKWWEFDHE